MSVEAPPLRSFWMAGFEGADHRNARGEALDMVRISGHAACLDADYARCTRFGLRTVRESIGWRLAEPRPGHYDLERLRAMRTAARRHGVQVLWSLMHYGMPDDLQVLHPQFVPRFAAFARAVAQALRDDDAPEPAIVTPINEIGFLAWVLSETDQMAGGPPRSANDAVGQARASSLRSGYAIKCRLVEATLAALRAMREVDPRLRFLQVEPLVHVTPPRERPELQALADEVSSFQWQVWDMLCGRLEPRLGGTPDALDLIGVNHYHDGQWEVVTEKRLAWQPRDARRQPFGTLLLAAWQRYRRPMIVSETSHVGALRAPWLDEIASEVGRVRMLGVALHGLTLYPIVDRPGWDAPEHWHHSGLWDAARPGKAPDSTQRVLCRSYAKALRRWQRRLSPIPHRDTRMNPPMIVFSHLRWDFVYQRPQHLLSRIAHRHRVFFIEEPVHLPGARPRFETYSPCDEVCVLRPISPVPAPGFHDDQLAVLKPLLQQLLQQQGLDEPIVWFYTPMALPLLTPMKPCAVVFDCMDELAAFRGAPKQMRQRESALFKHADLVLAGGPSLYRSKRELHPNVQLMPSAVDASHYAPERITQHCEDYLAAEQLQGHILAPRLGYMGVIDERLDLGLIEGIADTRPDWHLVMVGPVTKVDPATLPQRENIHWLGPQSYRRLPALVAGWDVCLLPFALNEHTEFISPTKTLEYLAAEKPVVGTPVQDVVAMYGEVVRIARDPEGFIAACDAAMKETPRQRAERLVAGASMVSRYSWDESARTVLRLIDEVLQQRRATAEASAAMPLAAAAGGAA
jgi:glycosyltransferase involved in cell wall biosynthesis